MPEITVTQDQLNYIERHGLDKILKQHSRLIQKGWPRYRAEWWVLGRWVWNEGSDCYSSIRLAKRSANRLTVCPRRVIDTITGAVVWEKG